MTTIKRKYKFLILSLFITIVNTLYAQQHIYPPQEELWNSDSLGTQRAVIRVNEKVDDVTVEINWRNRNVDTNGRVIVLDSTTQKVITDVVPINFSSEKGIVKFKTSKEEGNFYVYYLPYKLDGRTNYPTATYFQNNSQLDTEYTISNSSIAKVIRIESVDQFNSNQPMEVIATNKEVEELRKKYKNEPYLVFPEDRTNAIRMKHYLPQKWLTKDPSSVFNDEVKKGENYTFQLGVWAKDANLNDIAITYSDFVDSEGNKLSKDLLTCFNKEGINYLGDSFTKIINVEKNTIQALWFGVDIPTEISSGTYKGTITLSPSNNAKTIIDVELVVVNDTAVNNGIDEPWKQTRLKWINSTLAQDNSVIKPYLPVELSGNKLSILGRKVTLGKNGLPDKIESFFTEEMTSLTNKPKNILASPFRFSIKEVGGEDLEMNSEGVEYTKKESGKIQWKAINTAQNLTMEVIGSLEFDGFMNYEVKIIAEDDIEIEDISMVVPLEAESSKYMLGLGEKGKKLPERIDWKWNVKQKNQDGWWIGAVNAGLQLSLRDENYERPLNTNFYLQKPLKLPTSWGNDNKGGIRVKTSKNIITSQHYSGKRTMKKGDVLFYNFTLLITPFHTLQTDVHWNNKYFHAYKPIDTVIKSGSNVINIHHANELNPYINYPFIATEQMKNYIDEAHKNNLKVKIYNTVREVSNRLYELYPLRSLNNEVFSQGKGGGSAWLQEHLQDNYIAAWYVPKYKDAAIINSGMNRWHNYYVEGMNWLVQNIGIDGIYLDDVAFDRITMKRIKRVLTQGNQPGLIDLHSANQFNERDGFNNSAYLYLEHFPYINRLWFGEYFDYEKESPDFYLTEVSGIPFGLMGEMLQDGGNAWRGMLYGMTNRMPYQDKKPDGIWKVWDDFGIEGSSMIGYWVEKNPIKTNNDRVLVTVYKKEAKVLISIASWDQKDVDVKLNIDWEQLGIKEDGIKIYAPPIKDFQEEKTFKVGESISVEKNKGWLIILE